MQSDNIDGRVLKMYNEGSMSRGVAERGDPHWVPSLPILLCMYIHRWHGMFSTMINVLPLAQKWIP